MANIRKVRVAAEVSYGKDLKMKKQFLPIALSLILCHLCVAQVNTTGAQQPASLSDRSASEKLIRAALYEIGLATLTGDAKTFKKRAAKRTLDLYDTVFAELATNPKIKEQSRQAGITNGEGFLEYTFRSAARQTSSTPQAKLEEFAREGSVVPLTFVSDTEAAGENRIGSLKAVFEDHDWKIDIADSLKKVWLQTLPLSAESKKKIEKF